MYRLESGRSGRELFGSPRAVGAWLAASCKRCVNGDVQGQWRSHTTLSVPCLRG